MGQRRGNAGGCCKMARALDCVGRSTHALRRRLGQAFGLSDASLANPAHCDGHLPHVT